MAFRDLPLTSISQQDNVIGSHSISDGRGLYASHNWAEPFRVTTAYETDVAFSTYEANEQFVSRRTRPLRTVSASYLEGGTGKPHLEQFLARTSPRTTLPSTSGNFLRSGLDVMFQIALECDSTKITNVVGGGTVDGDFSRRRFYEGGLAYVVRHNRNPFTVGVEEVPALLVTLNSVSDSQVDLGGIPTDPSTGFDYVLQEGWTVVPSIDCAPSLSTVGRLLTSGVLEASIETVEFPNNAVLPPTLFKGVLPPDVSTFTDQSGIERSVFVVPHNWKSGLNIEFVRGGQEGYINRLAGTAPGWRVLAEELSVGRDSWWASLQMFDHVLGQGNSLWVVSPEAVTQNAERGAGDGSIVLPPQGNLNEFVEMTPALAYLDSLGNWSIVELDTPTPGSWDIPLLNNLTGTGPLGCVYRAFVARFGTDVFSESWQTRDVCDVSFSLTQTDFGVPEELGV